MAVCFVQLIIASDAGFKDGPTICRVASLAKAVDRHAGDKLIAIGDHACTRGEKCSDRFVRGETC